MKIEISTDGSCWPNPGPGGWAVIFRAEGHAKAIYGWVPHSTNIRMEMTAVIEALEHLKRGCDIKLHTDSEFVLKGITVWINRWRNNGYKTQPFRNKPAKDVANKDLWVRLDAATQRHKIEWVWVRGHAVHQDNNKCDELAMKARKEQIHGELVLVTPTIIPPQVTDGIVPIDRSVSLEDL